MLVGNACELHGFAGEYFVDADGGEFAHLSGFDGLAAAIHAIAAGETGLYGSGASTRSSPAFTYRLI